MTDEDGGALCRDCGLCCDGTLFGRVNFDEGEEIAGLATIVADGRRSFAQPCVQFRANACGIYDRRPGACQRFRCETLIALENGRIDFAAAQRRVVQARGALAELGRLAPLDEMRRPVESGQNPQRAIALLRLELILDRHFRRPDKRVLSPAE